MYANLLLQQQQLTVCKPYGLLIEAENQSSKVSQQ
jgi:hypothetical protein